MFEVNFCKLHISIQLLEDAFLPQYKESAIRGGIGNALLEQHCIMHQECDECPGRLGCVYANIMYSNYAIKPSFVTIGESISFVLVCDNRKEIFLANDHLEFTLTLFGGTFRYFYQLIQAISRFGEKGLGKNNTKFMLDQVRNRDGEVIYQSGNVIKNNINVETLQEYIDERKLAFEGSHALTMERKNQEPIQNQVKLAFLSPCTIKYKGEIINKFAAMALVENIHRRLFMLNCFEGIDVEYEIFEETDIFRIKKQMLREEQVRRYSNRKKAAIYLKGVSGFVWLDKVNEHLLDYLIAGEITHLGKNTRFGFGHYVLRM